MNKIQVQYHVVSNGLEAVQMLQQHRYDIVFMDIQVQHCSLTTQMPVMDGFEFVSELRKNQGWRSIPIVVITAKALTHEDRALLQGHVQKVLQKGDFSLDALLVELREIVGECVLRAHTTETEVQI